MNFPQAKNLFPGREFQGGLGRGCGPGDVAVAWHILFMNGQISPCVCNKSRVPLGLHLKQQYHSFGCESVVWEALGVFCAKGAKRKVCDIV